jgi:hypothetical protein
MGCRILSFTCRYVSLVAYAEIGSLGSVAKFVIYYGGFDMPTVAPLNKEILQKVGCQLYRWSLGSP